MLKLLAKVAEKYAKSTNTACVGWWLMHQPQMPASLVKKRLIKMFLILSISSSTIPILKYTIYFNVII